MISKIGNYIARSVSVLSKWLNLLGMAILGLLTCLTVADVLGRYLFKHPLLGTTEITEYMLVCIVFFSIAWCAVQKKHIVVSILFERLKPRVQAVLTTLTHTIGLGILALLTWQGALESLFMQESGKTSAILPIPNFPFYWIMTVGFGILCLQVLIELIQHIVRMVKS